MELPGSPKSKNRTTFIHLPASMPYPNKTNNSPDSRYPHRIHTTDIQLREFNFKNTGSENLIIRNIETGCGCTTANYTKEPVAPGKEGKIEIAFNSSGRYGKQYKEIRIFANIPEKVITLKFTADIKN